MSDEEKKDEPGVDEQEIEGFARVRRYWKDYNRDGEHEGGEDEPLMVRRFPAGSQPSTLSVKAGMTLQLGDGEYAKVDVFVSVPAYWEEREEAYEAAKNFVGKKVMESVDKLKAVRTSKPKA